MIVLCMSVHHGSRSYPCDRLFEHQGDCKIDVDPQHSGQKVLRGHVTADSGRRVMTQMKFDVMSVRELLSSFSALKRQEVIISFSRNHDRIIFRNETVNSGARDSYSNLYVALAHETFPSEAMVMTAKMYRCEMRCPKREVSDVDRRAIADADSAGQVGISRETKTQQIWRSPEPPLPTAIRLHNTTHVLFRTDLGFFLASQGRRSTHRRVVVNMTAGVLPKFQTHYMFIRSVVLHW